MKRRSPRQRWAPARRLAGVLGLLLLASAGVALPPAGAAVAAAPALLAQTDPTAGPSSDQLAAEAAARAAQQPQTDAGSGGTPPADPPASSPSGDSGGGSFCFPWPGGACIDLGKWLRDTADSIVTGLLSGLAQAVGGFLNWFIGQFNFVSRTPEDLSYRNPTVLRFTAATRAIAFGLLAVVVLVSGFNVLFRPALGSTYHGAMELLPRLALGGILIFSSSWWCQLAIDTNNALCGLVGTQALQDLLRLTQLNDPGVVVALLIYLAMFVLLILQQLMRLALVDVLLVLAPLAALCWILPQTYGWARLWGSLFVGTVFAQFVQVLALTLGVGLFSADTLQATGPGAALLQPLLGIGVLWLVWKIPGLMRGDSGGGNFVPSLVGTAVGAAVGGGVSRAIGAGLGGARAGVAARAGSGLSATQLSLPLSVGVRSGNGSSQLGLPLAVGQTARGDA